MNSQIFGCPGCNQRFQVLAQFAGQVVQCPTCAQSVEIPADAFSSSNEPTPPSSLPSDPGPAPSNSIYQCPHCNGQFGFTADMIGMQVACPHCHQAVMIGPESSPAVEPEFEIRTQGKPQRKKISIEPDAESDPVSDIKIKKSGRKKKTGFTPPPVTLQPDVRQSDLAPPSKQPLESPPSAPAPPRPAKPPEKSTPDKATQPTEVLSPTKVTPATESASPSSPTTSPGTAAGTPAVVSAPINPTPSSIVPSELPSKSDQAKEMSPNGAALVAATISIAHLLPPRFSVADPGQIRVKDPNDFKVLLPDGSGGTKQFDQRVLHVEHEGEKISLVALTPQQRMRRRLISNAIAILVGIVILAISFWLLS